MPGVRLNAAGGQFDPVTVDRLPGAIRHDVFFAITHAVQSVFIWAVPAAGRTHNALSARALTRTTHPGDLVSLRGLPRRDSPLRPGGRRTSGARTTFEEYP